MGPCLSPRERRTAGSSCFQKDPSHVNTEQEGWTVVFYLGRNEYDCWNFSYSDNSHHKQAGSWLGYWIENSSDYCQWDSICAQGLQWHGQTSVIHSLVILQVTPGLLWHFVSLLHCLSLSPFVLSSQMFFNITSFLFLYLYSCHTL